MKNLSWDFMTMLQRTAKTLALCAKITRSDGTEFFFTNHDRPITFDSDTYAVCPGFMPSETKAEDGGTVDMWSISGAYKSDGVTLSDLQSGYFDKAIVELFLVDYRNPPTAMTATDHLDGAPDCTIAAGTLTATVVQNNWAAGDHITYDTYKHCWIDSVTDTTHCEVVDRFGTNNIPNEAGAVTIDSISTGVSFMKIKGFVGQPDMGDTEWTMEFHSLAQVLKNQIGYTMQPDCPALFCDTQRGTRLAAAKRQCKLDQDNYTFSATVAALVDTRKEFTATITSPNVAGADCEVDEYLSLGEIKWLTGDNANLYSNIKDHDYTAAVHTLTLSMGVPNAIQVGDTFNVLAGCDRQLDTCRDKWLVDGTNVKNHRGFPFAPGPNAMRETPAY